VFALLFFYKIRFNFFSKTIKLASSIPYIKNLDNFLKASLLLHSN